MNKKKSIFIIFSSLSFITALFFYYNTRTFLLNSNQGEARVISVSGAKKLQTGSKPVSDSEYFSYSIEFTAPDGKKINSSITASTGNWWPVGGSVKILYDKNNPYSVNVRYSWKIFYYFRAIFFLCLSLIFDLAAFKTK